MDFAFSPAEEALRAELREWLARELPAHRVDWPATDDEFTLHPDRSFDACHAWHKRLHRGGWVGIAWPAAYGGRGASLVEQMVFQEEMVRAGAPPGVNTIGLMLAGPGIMEWGTEAQRRRFLPPILSADDIWCQGFSEPGAGSDLAALGTRAVLDGDTFRVSGQKVWTSNAQRSQWCILLARTDPSAPRHEGISCLLVDMRSPGITVRPLVQLTGDAEFNEVFLDDVRVPRDQLLGPLHAGWKVAITVLMYERTGLGNQTNLHHFTRCLLDLARQTPRRRRTGVEGPGGAAGARPVLDRDRDPPADEPPLADAPPPRRAARARGLGAQARVQRGVRADGGDGERTAGSPRTAVAGSAGGAGRRPLGLPDGVRPALRHRGRDVRDPAQHHRRSRAGTAPVVTERLLEAAREAAQAAGAIALRYFRGDVEVTRKADHTPVTRADREAEVAIVDRLRAAFPDIGFLGEEFGAQGSQSRRWIVDPIDGTKNFVRGIPYWATLLALEEEGEVTLGVVHSPATGELFWARRGQGAWADGTRLRVSSVDHLAEAMLVHSSLNLLRPLDAGRGWDGFVRLVEGTDRQRGFGDYFGYTFVLRGQAELMLEADVKPWDIAPIKVLIEEAGGRFTDLAGRPTIYSGTALASNGRLHAEALALLAGDPD